ncbi:aldehyde dehydrogenase PutA [Cryomyces antarcticus]
MPKPLQRIREAAIDGRTQNIYYRQTQLELLNDTLVQNSEIIQQAIIHDSCNNEVEARIEYSLALLSLREQYTGLSAAKSLEEEYAIAQGRDAPDRREGVGIVYVVPTAYTMFYSVIAPLGAAIAAGNCVVLELENTLREVPNLLGRLLKGALDGDTFAIASSRVEDAHFLAGCVQVRQDGLKEPPRFTQLASTPQARVVAVVDRTANLEEAAKALVTARFSFGGKSPYAPDCVLVNEFSKKDFLKAVTNQSIAFLTEQNGSTNKGRVNRGLEGKALVDEVREDGAARIVASGTNGAILDVERRESQLLRRKVSECCLVVHSVRSLDDAIDLANSNEDLLASYLFATPAAGKYLSQFIRSNVSFVNHIPVELLVGPAAPINYPVSATTRYSSILFTKSRPQYIVPSQRSSVLGEVLRTGSRAALSQVYGEATASLPVAEKRSEGGSIGFFEQGIVTGLSMTFVPLVAGIGTLGYFGLRIAMERRR